MPFVPKSLYNSICINTGSTGKFLGTGNLHWNLSNGDTNSWVHIANIKGGGSHGIQEIGHEDQLQRILSVVRHDQKQRKWAETTILSNSFKEVLVDFVTDFTSSAMTDGIQDAALGLQSANEPTNHWR